MSRVTVVLLTGISGTGIEAFAEKLIAFGRENTTFDWQHIKFSDRMREADQMGTHLEESSWEDTILNRRATLANLREVAAKQVTMDVVAQRKSETEKTNIVVISSHATFWYRKSLIAGMDFRLVNAIKPDFFFTLVDDALEIWKRLQETGQNRWAEIGLVDVLEWREIETFFTEQLSRAASSSEGPNRFFVIPKVQEPKTIVQIITEPETKKVYRSYPITSVKKRPEVQQEADRIGEELEKHVVVFDPLSIKDIERAQELQTRYEEWCKQTGSVSDWNIIMEHLSQQTVSRDHQLIDQSDAIVVFYPTLEYWLKTDNKYIKERLVPFSSGVLDEMHYATQRGKPVYLIWPEEKDPGPFFREIYTRKYKNIDETIKSILE